MMKFLSRAALAAAVGAAAKPILDDDRIREINSKGLGWTAGRNERFEGVSEEEYKAILGVKFPINTVNCPPPSAVNVALPDSFDARQVWPNYIHGVQDQGSCGDCWAFAATEILSDRLAIYSNGTYNFVLSAQALTDCDTVDQGCGGGWPTEAANWLLHHGVPTASCVPFYGSMTACTTSCLDGKSRVEYTWQSWQYATGEQPMMAALQTGPVAVSFAVYGGFESYTGGVYQRESDALQGYHAVKVVGYGTTGATDSPPNTKYWIVQNSWGVKWGEKGFFRILRGTNECGIELGALDKGCPIVGVPFLGPFPTPPPPKPASYHYGSAPCRADEQEVQVPGGGYMCSKACTTDTDCPSDLPPDTKAKPRCGLTGPAGKKFCGLHCTNFLDDGCPSQSDCQVPGIFGIGKGFCGYFNGRPGIVV